MIRADDGGPAFVHDRGSHYEQKWSGVSVRDYFAAQIAAALCSGPDGGVNPLGRSSETWQQATARTSYEVADAMLVARAA